MAGNMANRTSTILREFTKRNFALSYYSLPTRSTSIRPSKRSDQFYATAPVISEVKEWVTFTTEVCLVRLPEVKENWQLPHHLRQDVPNWQTKIFNEETLEHQVINPTIQDPVNAALEHLIDLKIVNSHNEVDLRNKHARVIEKDDLVSGKLNIYIGRGSRSPFRELSASYRSDWGLYSTLYNRDIYEPFDSDHKVIICFNLLTGDTKHSGTFDSSQLEGTLDRYDEYWNPIRQVLRYSKFAGPSRRRFGYIITEKELVVMRFTYKNNNAASNSRGSGVTQRAPTAVGPIDPDEYLMEYKVIKREDFWTEEHLKDWVENNVPGPMTMHLGSLWLCWKAAFGDDDQHDKPPSGGTRSQTMTHRPKEQSNK